MATFQWYDKAQTDIEIAQAQADAEAAAATDATARVAAEATARNQAVATAQSNAVATAAGDATTKAGNAQTAAIAAAATDATSKANAAQAAAVQRANHTGTQSADTITDGTVNKAFTAKQAFALGRVALFLVDGYAGADPTGAADSTTAIAAAKADLDAFAGAGDLYFGAGSTYKADHIPTLGALQGIRADSVKFLHVNTTANDFIRAFRPNYTTGTGSKRGGEFRGFDIDGTNAVAGSTGFHYGDLGEGSIHRIRVGHYNKAGSIGVYMHNVTGWAEKTDMQGVVLYDNTQNIVFDGGNQAATTASFLYGHYNFRMDISANQDGMVLQNAAQLSGGTWDVTFNAHAGTTNTGTVLKIGAVGDSLASHWDRSTVHFVGEGDGTGTGHKKITMGTGATFNSIGNLSYTNGPFTLSTRDSTATFRFSGYVNVDSVYGNNPSGSFVLNGLLVTNPGFMDSTGKIYLETGNAFKATLASGAQTVTFGSQLSVLSGSTGSAVTFDLLMQQPASGAPATATWPAGFVWPNGVAVLSTTNGAIDHVQVVTLDCVTFYAQHMNPSAATVRAAIGAAAALLDGGTQAANFTASPLRSYNIDTTTGAVLATLPAAPADGTRFSFKLTAGTVFNGVAANGLTVAAGGSDHFNTATGATTLSTSGYRSGFDITYTAATGVYRVTAFTDPAQDQLRQAAAFAPVNVGVTDFQAGNPLARAGQIPTFTKAASNPVMTIANQSLTSMQWPSAVYVGDIFNGPGPYGEYWRVYYSNDHSATQTTAGIALLTCANPIPEAGTWVDRGLVFRDTAGGTSNQTETPCVIYVPDAPGGAAFYMYYHRLSDPNGYSSEVNKLATMTVAQALTAESWTIHPTNNGIVIDTPADGFAQYGPGFYGYLRPFRVGQDWAAYTLSTGNPVPAFSIARSRTGLPGSWTTHPMPLLYEPQHMNDPQGRFNQSSHYLAWNSGSVFSWRGRLMWCGLVFAYAGGAGKPTYTYYVTAPISQDLRHLLSTPTVVFNAQQGWETAIAGAPAGMGDHRGAGTVVTGPDGKTRLFYLGAAGIDLNTGAKAAAGAIGLAVLS